MSSAFLRAKNFRDPSIVTPESKDRKPDLTSVHLLSFADSSLGGSRKRFIRQARSMKFFNSVKVFDENNLSEKFRSQHSSIVRKGVRGFGYWIWKPEIISQRIKSIKTGDVLIYADVGFHICPAGKNRLRAHILELTKSHHDMLVFQASEPTEYPVYDGRALPLYLDSHWTKGDLLDALNMRSTPSIHTPTIGAGLIFVKKTPTAQEFIEKWRDFSNRHPGLLDDSPSQSENLDGFVEHRHDQSLFSLLVKRDGNVIRKSAFEYWYPDPTNQSIPDWSALNESPFLAKRDKKRRKKARDFVRPHVKAVKRILSAKAIWSSGRQN